MIKYELNSKGIFEVVFVGDITFDEIVDYLNEFQELTNLPENLLIYYDLVKASLKLSPMEIISVAKKAKKATEGFQSIRTAFVAHDPMSTAYSILFIQTVINKKSTRRVFSTHESAILWLSNY